MAGIALTGAPYSEFDPFPDNDAVANKITRLVQRNAMPVPSDITIDLVNPKPLENANELRRCTSGTSVRQNFRKKKMAR